MELTPKVFRDVQFREKLRGGYHPEDVDAFLEQAAVASEELQQRLQRAESRADRAERSLEDSSTNDDTLKRVLFMAQRTADQAVREAREEAERLLVEARAQGQTIISDAEERGRRAYESKAAEARSNLDKTEDALRRAQREAQVLQDWVASNRADLLVALHEATAIVERAGLASEPPSELAMPPAPATTPAPATLALGDEAGIAALEEPVRDPNPEDEAGGGPVAGEAPPPRPEAAVDVRTVASPSEPGGPGREEAMARGGQWDQHFLDNLAGSSPSAEPRPQGGDDTQPATVAFDERALDNFFQEQDMGAERGLGRFRRRS